MFGEEKEELCVRRWEWWDLNLPNEHHSLCLTGLIIISTTIFIIYLPSQSNTSKIYYSIFLFLSSFSSSWLILASAPVIQLSIVWHKSRTILPLFTNPLQYGLVNICLQQCHVCCYAILSTFVADGKVEKSQQDPWGSKVFQRQFNSEK